MHPLTEKQIRSSFVNASKREAADATLPDLDAVDWDRIDYLGWTDRRAPLAAYVVVRSTTSPSVCCCAPVTRAVGAGRPSASGARTS